MTGYELHFADTAVSMIPWVIAGLAIIVAAVAAEHARMWRGRCEDKTETDTGLRNALDDARYETARRATPAPVVEWHEPPVVKPARFVSVWPGRTQRDLPIAYGPGREHLELDPCLTTAPVLDLEWLNEPQAVSWPLDVEGICIERVLTALEHLGDEPTAQMWVVPHLQETQ